MTPDEYCDTIRNIAFDRETTRDAFQSGVHEGLRRALRIRKETREVYEAGRAAESADREHDLTIAYMDGHARGRESLRRELEGQEAVAFRCRVGGPGPWTYVDHRAPDSFELRECEIQNLHLGPPPDVLELVEAGKLLSFAAQTSGGTAGRDDDLIEAIGGWSAALAKFGGVS